jgi:hypothetical protein
MARSGFVGNTVQWKIGLAAMYPEMSKAAKLSVKRAVDKGFEATQMLVHVDTGRTKSSGRIVERDQGYDFVYEVTYGGQEFDVDYAGWLELFYPYLQPGMEQGMATFADEPNLLIGPFG